MLTDKAAYVQVSDTKGQLMSLEEQLTGWTKPSSDTEKDKQDRTERMIR